MSNKYAYNRKLEEEKDIQHKNGKPREDTIQKIEDMFYKNGELKEIGRVYEEEDTYFVYFKKNYKIYLKRYCVDLVVLF